MSQSNVLILASNRFLQEALKLGLRRTQLVVIGEGKRFDEALETIGADTNVDLVIALGAKTSDIDTVLDDIRLARSAFPASKCVVVAEELPSVEVLQALQAGADAILSMDASLSTLLNFLRLVLTGQQIFPTLPVHLLSLHADTSPHSARPAPRAISPIQAEPMASATSNLVPFGHRAGVLPGEVVPLSPLRSAVSVGDKTTAGGLVLSDREEQILRCLVNGKPNKAIARELGIAETTVKVHVKSVLRKVRASNRTQAAIWAVNHGSMQPGPETRPVGAISAADKSSAG